MPFTRPNIEQVAVDNYINRFNCAIDHGMFKPSGGCPSFQSSDAPWLIKPPQSKDFRYEQTASIANVVAGVDLTVVSFESYLGYDGVVSMIVNEFQDPAYVNGSGNVVWRIKVDFRYVENYANIISTLGESDNPFIFGTGGIKFREKQIVSLVVNIADPSIYSQNSLLIGGLAGWQYRLEPYSRVYA